MRATGEQISPLRQGLSLSNEEAARLLAEAPRVTEVALSPDGSAVAYSVDRSSIETNQHTGELFLQKLDTHGAPDGGSKLLGRFSSSHLSVQWCPDGRCLTYFQPLSQNEEGGHSPLVKYELGSSTLSRVPLHDTRELTPALDEYGQIVPRRRVTYFQRMFRWSPNHRYIAFGYPLSEPAPLNPRAGVVQPNDLAVGAHPRFAIFVVDVETGKVEQATPDTLNVHPQLGFDWAPDERALVVAATRRTGAWNENESDLFIVERGGEVRTLVTQPGSDKNPSWSPDGKYIAFSSSFGDPDGFTEALAVIPAVGGQIERVARGEDDPAMGGIGPGVWTADGKGFYYRSGHRMAVTLVYADIGARIVSSLAPASACYDDRSHSFSTDRRRVAFVRSSLTSPPEVYVQTLPTGEPKRVTAMGSELPFASLVSVNRIDWPSRDGRFTIEGMLLSPRSSRLADTSQKKAALPAVVYNDGGPGMVVCGFARDGYNGAAVALAAHGYAVLIPNTRGREGYGPRFKSAFRDEQGHYRPAYEDVMSGVDVLVRDGIADASRLGIFGHSYGANLTAYSITATSRFKAAAVHEAIGLDLTSRWVQIPGTAAETNARRLSGVRNPFDPAFIRRVLDESAILRLGQVSTPTLLQFGQWGNAKDAGIKLFAGLQHAKVPTEFVIYSSGHGVLNPSARADELSRVGAWFDYWLRNVPYPDSERARAYDEWRSSNHLRAIGRQSDPW